MGERGEQVLVAVDVGKAARAAGEEEAGVEAGTLARSRFEVVEGEVELTGEGADAVVGGVDELAAVLGRLPAGASFYPSPRAKAGAKNAPVCTSWSSLRRGAIGLRARCRTTRRGRCTF